MVIPFEGTGARVIHSKGPEGGLFNLQVDSGSILTADSFAEHYSYGHFASIEGLAPGLHTLTVTNGTGAIWIEAVQFQEPVGSVVALLARPTQVIPQDLQASQFVEHSAQAVVEDAMWSGQIWPGGTVVNGSASGSKTGWSWAVFHVRNAQPVSLDSGGQYCAYPTYSTTPARVPQVVIKEIRVNGTSDYRTAYWNETLGGFCASMPWTHWHEVAYIQVEIGWWTDDLSWNVTQVDVSAPWWQPSYPTPTPTLTPTPTPTFTPTPTPSPTTQPVCIVEVTAPKNWYPHPAPARTERFGLVPDPYTTPIGVFQVGDQLELDARYFRGVASEPSFETFIYRVKKVNGIDVGSEAWINTNHGLTGINTVNCESPYLDLQVQPRNSREAVLENIRDYGVDVQATVSDGSIIIPQGLSEPWSLQELESILDGIELVAGAFGHYSTIKPPQTLFRGVMTPAEPDYFMFRRISGAQCEVAGENRVVVDCGYMQNPPIPSSGPHWTPNGLLTSEAAIHEMGHVFDIRTSMYLRSQVSGASVLDCRQVISNAVPFVVFGNSGEGWIRGQNGWGDSALNASGTAQISQFQQNPAAEDYETAADTFLNWVYRRTSDSTAISLNLDDACIISDTGKWLGFQNINKQNESEIYQDSQGSNHNARSGNRRYVWMHIIIEGVFNGNTN